MRSASGGLKALIASGLQEWAKADLYTFQKYDGTVLGRFTDADVDIYTGTPKITLPGSSGNYVSTPDSATNSITGDIDIRARVMAVDWTPTLQGCIVGKNVDSTQCSYRLDLLSVSGKLRLSFSPDGTVGNRLAADSTVGVGATDGTIKWVRGTLDVNDGSGNRVINFYTSDDYNPSTGAGTWTQLGTTVTQSGTTSIFNSTSPVEVGSTNNGTSTLFVGSIYYVEIRNGIGGTKAVTLDPSDFANPAATSGVSSLTGETWTINKSGSPSAAIALDVAQTFSSSGPLFMRELATFTVGLEVDQLRVKIVPDPSLTIGGLPWLTAMRQGLFDGGSVLVDRFMSDSFANFIPGIVKWFGGHVADIEIGRSEAIMTLASDVAFLNIQLPRNTYQPACRWTLFDTGCTLNKALFTVPGTVSAGSDKRTLNTNLTKADGYFDLGTIQFTSGANNGLWRMVRSYLNSSGKVTLGTPLPNTPVNGDTFTIYPGCDKKMATCGAYANIVFTADSGTDTLTSNGHGLANDESVRLVTTGTLPAPLTTTDAYFVINTASNTFKLSATLGGSAVNLSDNGSGIHAVRFRGKFGNLPNFGGQPYIPPPGSPGTLSGTF